MAKSAPRPANASSRPAPRPAAGKTNTRPAEPPSGPRSAAGKKKRPEVTTDPAQLARQASSVLVSTSVDAMRSETGSLRVMVASQSLHSVFGIPVPLAFQILIQNNVLPFGAVIIITGDEGTCKSGLLFQMGEWFGNSGGILQFLENESKYDPIWATSIMGWPDEVGRDNFAVYPCDSVEDWQTYLTRLTAHAKQTMDGATRPKRTKGTGRIYPVLWGLDSLTAKLAVETQDKMESDGHANRSHPLEAMQITSFLKKFPTDMAEWPFVFCAVNHQKTDITVKPKPGMPAPKRKPGGKHTSYQEAIEIEMLKGERPKINLIDSDPSVLEVGGLSLRIRVKKNSLGETYRELPINVVWRYRMHAPTGQQRQYTVFDWHGALVDYLTKFTGERGAKIRTIVDLVKGTNDVYHSKRLGISKENAVSKSEMGRLVESDPEVVRGLQKMFAVHVRHVFQPGVDFRKQLQAAVATAQRRMNQ